MKVKFKLILLLFVCAGVQAEEPASQYGYGGLTPEQHRFREAEIVVREVSLLNAFYNDFIQTIIKSVGENIEFLKEIKADTEMENLLKNFLERIARGEDLNSIVKDLAGANKNRAEVLKFFQEESREKLQDLFKSGNQKIIDDYFTANVIMQKSRELVGKDATAEYRNAVTNEVLKDVVLAIKEDRLDEYRDMVDLRHNYDTAQQKALELDLKRGEIPKDIATATRDSEVGKLDEILKQMSMLEPPLTIKEQAKVFEVVKDKLVTGRLPEFKDINVLKKFIRDAVEHTFETVGVASGPRKSSAGSEGNTVHKGIETGVHENAGDAGVHEVDFGV